MWLSKKKHEKKVISYPVEFKQTVLKVIIERGIV